jgi:hypothetical protein
MSEKVAVLAVMILSMSLCISVNLYGQENDKSALSAEAFLKASEVLKNPRCVNCHPRGERPLQGNDSHPHTMNVMRGPEGLGKNGLWCSTCHQEMNLPGAHMPPGALGWSLPPKDMPMVFEGVSPHELCEHFKDPAQNGHRSPDEVLEHVETGPVVLWAWDPGEGRTPIPVSHEEFIKDIKEWVDNGAACPE